MNAPTAVSHPSPAHRHSVWRWILGVVAVGTLAMAIGIYNLVTLARDAQALRDEVLASLNVRTRTRIQGSVGPVLLGSVRAGLHFVHGLPADARDALAAVRAASVGDYRVIGSVDAKSRAAMFASADAVMNRRGWIRVVGVNNGNDTVLIYTPARADWGNTQRVCLAVCDREELVVVAATADTNALRRLAERHGEISPWRELAHHGVEL